jgi:hypothetical protein
LTFLPLVHTEEVIKSGLLSVPLLERQADTLEVPIALSGPAHYIKADELLAEIEATPAISNETGTSLATRAIAHTILAAAAAIALSSSGPDSRAWSGTAGTTHTGPPA